jgi:MFS family permease
MVVRISRVFAAGQTVNPSSVASADRGARSLYLGYTRDDVKVFLNNRYNAAEAVLVEGDPLPERGRGLRNTFAAFRHRNFRLFYIGHLLSLSGTWLQVTALGWLVLDLTDSELWLGVVNASTSAPILVFSLYAGVLADRRDKRSILIAAQWVAFAQALALGVLTHLGMISIGWIVVLALTLGIANAFEIPTRQSFFVELVGEKDLTNAIALNSSAFNATRMVGPAVAGALIGAVGVAACFYSNALSYFAVIVGLLMIRRVPPVVVPRRLSAMTEIREGFAWIRQQPVARTVVVFMSLASVLVFPFTMLLPVFARDILEVGPQGLGLLFSATGGGALVAGISLASMSEKLPRGRLLLISATAFCFFVSGFAISRYFLLSVAFLACAGFCMILCTATANSLLQVLVPNELRGRVMSVYIVMFLGVTPVGYLQAGALARAFGATPALVGASAVLLTILVTRLWRMQILREFV